MSNSYLDAPIVYTAYNSADIASTNKKKTRENDIQQLKHLLAPKTVLKNNQLTN